MSLEREGIPSKQVQLLYPTPDISLSVRVSRLLDTLEQNNTLHTNNEKLIVARNERLSTRVHIATGKSVPVTEVKYDIYDARNGLENFSATGMVIKDKIFLEQGTIFEYATRSNPDQLKRPYIDTVRTAIKKSPDSPNWEGSLAIYRNEYDDLALISNTQILFRNIPSEKNLDLQMQAITKQIAIVGGADGYKVSLKTLKKGIPPQQSL